MSRQHRLTATLAAALAVGAVVAPAGVAKPPDLTPASWNGAKNVGTGYTPGAVASWEGAENVGTGYTPGAMAGSVEDLRSVQDLRHLRAGGDSTQKPLVRGSSSSVSAGSSSNGFEWASAAAGAGGMLVIGLAGVGSGLAVSRRRRAPGANPTTVAAGH